MSGLELLLAVLLAVAACAVVHFRGQVHAGARVADLLERTGNAAIARVHALEQMLDEARAQAMGVVAPHHAVNTLEPGQLPIAVVEALDGFDPDTRALFEQHAHEALAADPTIKADALIAQLFNPLG